MITVHGQPKGLCEMGIVNSEHVLCHNYVYAEQVQICMLSIRDWQFPWTESYSRPLKPCIELVNQLLNIYSR